MEEELIVESCRRLHEDDTPTIDLDQLDWERIKAAAAQSNWIPEEYYMNDWVSDVCAFLKDRSVCGA